MTSAVAQPPMRSEESRIESVQTSFVVDRITRQSEWFYPYSISDEEACDILRGGEDGCFLVRASSIPNSFILSFCHNDWIHHWLLVTSNFGVTLKRSDLYFGNIYELITFFCSTVEGSQLPCKLSLYRNQQFLSSSRRTATTRSAVPPPPPVQFRAVAPRHHRREVVEERDMRAAPRVRRRVQHRERPRTLLTFDVVSEAPSVMSPTQAEDAKSTGNRHYERHVERRAGAEPYVHEITTIEREYDLADGSDGESYTSSSSYSTACSKCQRGHAPVRVVRPAVNVSTSAEMDRSRDVMVERERTVRTRREVDGVPVGVPETRVYRSLDRYVEENGNLVLKSSEELPAQGGPEVVVNAASTPMRAAAARREPAFEGTNMHSNAHYAHQHHAATDYSSIPVQSSMEANSRSDFESRSHLQQQLEEYRCAQQERWAAEDTSQRQQPARTTRAEQSEVERQMEEMTVDKRRTVKHHRVVDGREDGPPQVTTTHHYEHFTRGPDGRMVRDNVIDEELPRAASRRASAVAAAARASERPAPQPDEPRPAAY